MNYNEFINNVVDRLYYWIQYYNDYYKGTEVAKEKFGVYAEFSTNYDYCANTGIFGEYFTKKEVKNNGKTCKFFDGFDWTKEKLRIELDRVVLKIWKENETINKLKRIEEDFK